jgi:tRNA pseudouridine synthase 10
MPRSKPKKEKGSRAFAAQMNNPQMKALAERIFDKHSLICDNCLGRQFGQISTGMTNNERGKIIRRLLKMKPQKKPCQVCKGIFQTGLRKWSERAMKRIKGIEYNSFVVGSRLSKQLISNEEELWGHCGIAHCEPIKTELNRELGKLIWKKTRKKVNELNPDLVILFDFENNKIILQINPLFIYGEYRKLVRGIPQTKWDMYKVSVEDIIAKPVMKATGGKGHAMHGAGREDIDALCLGWRPFVLEISEPKKRRINLRSMQQLVNKSRKANVRMLRYSEKKKVAEIKAARHDKTYRLLVQFKERIDQDKISDLKNIIGTIRQKTPERVMHRRSDLTRTRKVKNIKWKSISYKRLEVVIKGEAGLYVKELVTGDNGRTTPSVSATLNNPAKVIELDVIKIHKIHKK